MGITNLLPALESISHKVILAGAQYLKVTVVEETATRDLNRTPLSMEEMLRKISRKRKRVPSSFDHDENIERCTNEDHETHRHLRIGVDISTWISAACHGNGAELIDERHLSNFGRRELELQATTHATDAEEEVAQRLQQEKVQNFITIATNAVMRKIKSVQYLVSPQIIVVLDGASPPIKKGVVEERRKSRTEAAIQRDALAYMHTGKTNSNISIDQHANESNSRKIASAKKAGAHTSKLFGAVLCSVLETLRENKIPFLVAPYEADSQLAYLQRKKYIDFIISEDSDFIPFGADAILYKYKLDVPFETGIDVKGNNPGQVKNFSEDFFRNAKATASLILKEDLGTNTSTSFSLLNFTDLMIAMVCVASGCDYAPSLKGIGLVHARNAVDEACVKNDKMYKQGTTIENLIKCLAARSYNSLGPEETLRYRESFVNALVMFRHPVVFDPILGKCVFANIDAADAELMDYKLYADIVNRKESLQNIVGEVFESEIAIHIAEGWINPKGMELRYDEKNTPGNVVLKLQQWKQLKSRTQFQEECDRINDRSNTGDPQITIQSQEGRSREVVALACTSLPGTNETQNPSQSTMGTSSASKFSTQGSHQSNSNISTISPDLLAL